MVSPVLRVEDLAVTIDVGGGSILPVAGVSFELGEGETLAIVGESGSGKSLTAKAILGLAREPGITISGSVQYGGRDLLRATERELQDVRGHRIGMVLQDAMTSLNPVMRIGVQIVEAVRAHSDATRRSAQARAVDLLREVGLADPEVRARAYPHELSGGMRQRALVAMALACDPDVLIADEPTTALDVTVQAQVLELLRSLTQARGSALVLITHDLGIVAEVADHVAVMYAGQIVEKGSARDVFRDPQHPYTWGLLRSSPRADRPAARRMRAIAGSPPSPAARLEGCQFRPRCAVAFERCCEPPTLLARLVSSAQVDRCWLEPMDKRRLRAAAEESGAADG